jgi:ketosteroid isomerase-like protein
VTGVVTRYLGAIVAHDWPALTECLTPDVVRVGPYGDTYTPRDAYVAFLTELMPALPGYSMELHRVVEAGSVAVAELSETVEVEGAPLVTPESLVFDFAPDGRIARIAVYIQRVGGAPELRS